MLRPNLIAAIALAGLTSCAQPMQQTALHCAEPSDQSTFELQALRSELVVLTLNCHDDRRYNAFVKRFRPVLQSNERQMSTYFQHRGGQVAHDAMVTDLANAMSEAAIGQGAAFCAHDGPLLAEAMTVAPAGLATFAADRVRVPPTVTTCTERQS